MVEGLNLKNKPNDSYLTETQAGKLWRQKVKTSKPEVFKAGVVLKEFHKSAKDQSRLKLLQDISFVILEDVDNKELNRRRQQFDKGKHKFPITGNCWCCDKKPAEVRHHIIWLKNGGPVLSKRNLVLLCAYCHNELHPWLLDCGIAKTLEVGKYKADLIAILDDFVQKKLSKEDAKDELLLLFESLCESLP